MNRALELDPEPGADSMSSGYGVPSAATYTVPPPLLLVSTSATVEWPSTALEGPKADRALRQQDAAEAGAQVGDAEQVRDGLAARRELHPLARQVLAGSQRGKVPGCPLR